MAPVLVTARVDSEAAYPVSVAQTIGTAALAGGSTSAPPRWATTGHSGGQPVQLESTASGCAETRAANAIVESADETFGDAHLWYAITGSVRCNPASQS